MNRHLRLTIRRDAVREAIVDRQVHEAAWQAVASALQLPDPDDVDVLARAIAGHADCTLRSISSRCKNRSVGRSAGFCPRGCTFAADIWRMAPKLGFFVSPWTGYR